MLFVLLVLNLFYITNTVYNSDMIIIVLFNLSESVVSKNVVKYMWCGSKLVELKCRSFSVILIGMLKFVIVM